MGEDVIIAHNTTAYPKVTGKQVAFLKNFLRRRKARAAEVSVDDLRLKAYFTAEIEFLEGTMNHKLSDFLPFAPRIRKMPLEEIGATTIQDVNGRFDFTKSMRENEVAVIEDNWTKMTEKALGTSDEEIQRQSDKLKSELKFVFVFGPKTETVDSPQVPVSG